MASVSIKYKEAQERWIQHCHDIERSTAKIPKGTEQERKDRIARARKLPMPIDDAFVILHDKFRQGLAQPRARPIVDFQRHAERRCAHPNARHRQPLRPADARLHGK